MDSLARHFRAHGVGQDVCLLGRDKVDGGLLSKLHVHMVPFARGAAVPACAVDGNGSVHRVEVVADSKRFPGLEDASPEPGLGRGTGVDLAIGRGLPTGPWLRVK